MINLLPEDQKIFIKENILFAGKPWPMEYKRFLYNDDMSWKQIRGEYGKIYGWKYYKNDDGDVKRFIPEIEPIPKGYKAIAKNHNSSAKLDRA